MWINCPALSLLVALTTVVLDTGQSGPTRRRHRPSHNASRAHLKSLPPPAMPCPTTTNKSAQNSFLWTVARDPPSYLFGTIHVPYTRVWEHIPENSKDAFYASQYAIFELDLMDPITISALNNCQLLPYGQHLTDVIPRELFERIEQHLDYVRERMPNWMTEDQKGRGLYADYLFNAITGNWERKRPVYVMLMINALTEADIKWRGTPVLDVFLTQEAHRMNKRTGAVEEVDDHCVPLNSMDTQQVIFALNHTLVSHELLREGRLSSTSPSAADLIGHYNCGDLHAALFGLDTAQVPNLLSSTFPPSDLGTARQIDTYFREELIRKRNERMARRIQHLLRKHPKKSFFFAFGAGHFLGNGSVIGRLQDRGLGVQHTPPDEEITISNKKRKRQHSGAGAAGASSSTPPFIISGNLEYLDPFYDRRRLRNRQRQDRGRKRTRQRQPKQSASQSKNNRPVFNHLWVRIDASSSASPAPRYRDVIFHTPPTFSRVHAPHSHAASVFTARCSPIYIIVLLVHIRLINLWIGIDGT